jgi:hypothetical protein
VRKEDREKGERKAKGRQKKGERMVRAPCIKRTKWEKRSRKRGKPCQIGSLWIN